MTNSSNTYPVMPLPKKLTARQAIINRLAEVRDKEGRGGWLAVHELHIWGHGENAMATELSKMCRDGLVAGRFREGERFKEWYLLG